MLPGIEKILTLAWHSRPHVSHPSLHLINSIIEFLLMLSDVCLGGICLHLTGSLERQRIHGQKLIVL